MAHHDPINVVMIGCGKFARFYHVPVLLADPATRIVGIFDPDPAAATIQLAERIGIPIAAGLAALPTPTGTTMAIVTTPHALHGAHVSFALSRDWHVLCDKPFVLTVAEARALAAQAERQGRVNAVAFNRRFDRGCLRAREAIRTGRIGPVRYVETVQLGYEREGWFRLPALGGGGPFTGRATHMADIVPWLLDRAPTRLRSRIRGGTAAQVDRGGFIDLLFEDLECHMTCIEEGWHMWDEIRIFGEDGMLELRRPLHQPIGWSLAITTQRGTEQTATEADPTPGGATNDVLAALRTGSAVACSFADAVVATAIVEAAFASARDGGAWRALG